MNVSTDNLRMFWESRRECGLALIMSNHPQKGENGETGVITLTQNEQQQYNNNNNNNNKQLFYLRGSAMGGKADK